MTEQASPGLSETESGEHLGADPGFRSCSIRATCFDDLWRASYGEQVVKLVFEAMDKSHREGESA
jgi:hypothetical protein